MTPFRAVNPGCFIQLFMNIDDRARSVSKRGGEICDKQADAESPQAVIKRRSEKNDDEAYGKHKRWKCEGQRADKLENLCAGGASAMDGEGHDDSGKDRYHSDNGRE